MIDPGRLFMFGLQGLKPSRDSVALLKFTQASGILLLARNIDTPKQTKALTEELVQRVGRPLLFAVDHEGGWVLRFKSGITGFPGNAALGRAGNPKLAYATGQHMALEIAPLGIQMNLAPVLDVLTDEYNPGIGIRSFGHNPHLVARLGAAFIRGLQQHGMSACAKHFPGKGAARVDAHINLPTIRLKRTAFLKTHLVPFAAAVAAGADAVMTSHVRFPAFDTVPATFSAKITTGLLRTRLGFDGLVISDDLCMGAITGRWPIARATLKALEAGHDMLMIAHDTGAQVEAVELLRNSAASGGLKKQRLLDADRRIHAVMTRYVPQTRKHLDVSAGLDLAKIVATRALEQIQSGHLKLPLSCDGQSTLFLIPDFKQVKERFTFEGGARGPEAYLRKLSAPWGKITWAHTPIETADLGTLPLLVRSAQRIVFFCFEARRFAGQRTTLELLNRDAADRTAVCLIRSSWDRSLISPRMTALDTYGYRLCQLEAAFKLLLGVPS